ncbi:MAG: GMC family oxidoreductase, partial [Gammaproteobacteria bacterium]|nr:GMC family oxidoreductase [Gammaproteobacteria bacterium]
MAAEAVDVIVIGSGAGGAACAWGLAEGGVNTLLLESGPAYDPTRDYRLERNDWEQSHFPHKVNPRGRQTMAPLQALDERWDDLRSWNHLRGRLVPGDKRTSWGYQHVVGLGGSTLHYTGEAHRMHPGALRLRGDFGVGADWPLDYGALDPWYVKAEHLLGVAGPEDPRRPRGKALPMPAHELSYASRRVAKGCASLGFSWQQNTVAIPSRAYRQRPPCNYCGQCSRGCSRRDKGSADLTFIPAARATGRCEIRTGATVVALEPGADDRVAAVRYVTPDGSEHRVRGRVVVVACGAVETPRLLLNSAGAGAPDGLANESGLVGRNFMETLFCSVSGLHPDALGSHRGLPNGGICWDFNAPDAVEGMVGGSRYMLSTGEADLTGPLNYARRVVGGWGRAHKTAMREQFGHALSVSAVGENLPNAGSYIDLDPDRRDGNGLPLARIASFLPDSELLRLRFMMQTAQRILEAAGVDQLIERYGS